MELFHMLHAILFLLLFLLPNCVISSLALSRAHILNHAPDELALLAFKSAIVRDPFGLLGQWNRSLHFCLWPGVTCGGRRHPNRVRVLNLGSMNLTGSIPPCLSNLTFLRMLSLSENQLYGHIPWQLGHLSQLQHLNLSFNSLGGDIPATLSRCSRLQAVSLEDNTLQGMIPFGVAANCSKLQTISLSNNKLQGEIPSNLSRCSKLQYINLQNNMLVGEIPSELGTLPNLSKLSLSTNELTGSIPQSLGNISSLYLLDLKDNHLTGTIPISLGNPSSLSSIELLSNSITGGIPPSLGNLSSLLKLDLGENSLSGSIPPSLGKLSSLTYLDLSFNQLSRVIPFSIYNLSDLYYLVLCSNKFHGALPKDIGYTLPGLQYLRMYDNQLHGPLPMSLANASQLVQIELYNNRFSGTIPGNLATLQSLSSLDLFGNYLQARETKDWSFLAAITNSSLQVLEVTYNLLEGMLPNFVANNSTSLTWLGLAGNQISGTIPSWIWNLRSLEALVLGGNFLSGIIHLDIGNLQKVNMIYVDENQLSGEIPSTIGNLTLLSRLVTKKNHLTGSIPTSLENCQWLELLDLSHNHLTGPISKEVLGIPSLSISLDLSHNFLTGSLSSEVGSLKNLREIRITDNKLSGEIPSTLGQCEILEVLYMDGNFFQGNIPQSLSGLKGIQQVDLSRNNLSGHIPEFLRGLRALNFLNLSFNNFEGRVPQDGVFGNASGFFVLGNNKLCGGIMQLHLPPCIMQMSKTNRRTHFIRLALPLVVAVLCMILFSLWLTKIYRSHKSSQKSLAESPMNDHHLMKVSYHELLKATDGFSAANLIGVGSFGSVYKGILGDKKNVVAVKVLNLQLRGALKNFTAECEALRNIRHRNLVRILTSCSSIDFNGNEFKALVFEYMSNGNLDRWLHPEENDQHELRHLSLIQRLNIANDVATAIDYLHHHGHMSIVHCDIKPSNILLDNEMIARVGDFGLARLLLETITTTLQEKTSSSRLKGSIGYIAPEYGMANKVSTQGDVYSYGIFILEMFTGKRPIDDIFMDGLCLRQYVSASYSEKLMDIVDPVIFKHDKVGDTNENITRRNVKDCLASVLRIGLLCTEDSPSDRINMGDVTKKMRLIIDTFFGI